MRRMLLSEPGESIDAVMNHNVISVPPLLDQEDVARKLAKYDLNVLPVVNDRGRILGVITADDVLDVLTDEQSEDVQKMGAIEPLRDDYFSTSFRVLLAQACALALRPVRGWAAHHPHAAGLPGRALRHDAAQLLSCRCSSRRAATPAPSPRPS